jgi:hypothetical protein
MVKIKTHLYRRHELEKVKVSPFLKGDTGEYLDPSAEWPEGGCGVTPHNGRELALWGIM